MNNRPMEQEDTVMIALFPDHSHGTYCPCTHLLVGVTIHTNNKPLTLASALCEVSPGILISTIHYGS